MSKPTAESAALKSAAFRAALIVLMLMGIPVIGVLVVLNIQQVSRNPQVDPNRQVDPYRQVESDRQVQSDQPAAGLPSEISASETATEVAP